MNMDNQHEKSLQFYLETKIVNFGLKFEHQKLRRFKTFTYGVADKDMSMDMKQGIGIGLSTADALAGALGGRVYVTSTEQIPDRLYRTEVTFKIKLTNQQQADSYGDDLSNLRKLKEIQQLNENSRLMSEMGLVLEDSILDQNYSS